MKRYALAAAALAAAAIAGGAVHKLATDPSDVAVHSVTLTLRPLVDGGTELDESAFGKRDGKHTGESKHCAFSAECNACISQASSTCEW